MRLRTNLLAHFSPMFDFYTHWKRQKTQGFLTFSGGIEMENWGKTDERKISGNFRWESPILELRFIYDEWKTNIAAGNDTVTQNVSRKLEEEM